MGFLEFLTIIFIVLKVTETVSFSWLVVFSPLIVALVAYFIIFVVWGRFVKKFLKHWKRGGLLNLWRTIIYMGRNYSGRIY